MANEDRYFLRDGIHALVWMDLSDPKVVHLTTNDRRFVLPGSDKGPGLHLAFNDNPRSANYNPVALARSLEAMRRDGVNGVPEHHEIFIRNRHVNIRHEVIAEYEQFIEPRENIEATFDVPTSKADELRQDLQALQDKYAV